MAEPRKVGAIGAKRQFLVHIDEAIIKRVKIRALEERISASLLVQQALVEFLEKAPVSTISDATRESL